jgi:hypothetical protein
VISVRNVSSQQRDSSELGATQVVVSLDEPIEPEKNAVWCASLTAAWQALGQEVAEEPPRLVDDGGLSDALNRMPDVTTWVSPENHYRAAGWATEGIAERIRREMAERFPQQEIGELEEDLIAYAYLEAKLSFTIPYPVQRKPFFFPQSDGREVAVHAFGLGPEDAYRFPDLRRQARLLFHEGRGPSATCVVDLCHDSHPERIIVARIPRPASLQAALQWLGEATQGKEGSTLGQRDELLVPMFDWRIGHRERRLEGRRFANPKLRGAHTVRVQQDVRFRLDESGAELASEAIVGAVIGESRDLVLSSGFLVAMGGRATGSCYFAMWVDNAELMVPFDEANLPVEPEPPPHELATMVEVGNGYARLRLDVASGRTWAHFSEDHGRRWRKSLSLEELHSSDFYLEIEPPEALAGLAERVTVERSGVPARFEPAPDAPGLPPAGGRERLRIVADEAFRGARGTDMTVRVDEALRGAAVYLLAVRNEALHAAHVRRMKLPRYEKLYCERRDDGAHLSRFAGDKSIELTAPELKADPIWLRIRGGAEPACRSKLATHLMMASWSDFGGVIAGTDEKLPFEIFDEPPPGLEAVEEGAYVRLIKEGPRWASILEGQTFAIYLSVFHGQTEIELFREKAPALRSTV